MATIPVFVGFGNSNWDGIATVAAIPAADYLRWVSTTLPATDLPYSAKSPGVQMFALRFPYAAATTRDITAVPTTTSFTMDSAVAGTTVDQWCYILENSTGQGQLRRITVNPATATPTVGAVFSPAIAPDGQVMILGSSHTTNGASTTTVVGGQDRTVITKTGSTGAFTSSMVGKWLIGIAGSNISVARRIVAFISATVVHTERFPVNFANGDGIRVLDGANAVNGIADINVNTGAFRDFEFFYDAATSYSTGFEYPTLKSTPKTSPLTHNNSRLTNLLPELVWQMRQRFSQRLHVVSLGAAASTLAPAYAGTALATEFSWAHDVTQLDFHPSSVNGLYQVLVDTLYAACKTIITAGNTPDVIGFGTIIAENDAATEAAANTFGENLRLLRDSLRKFVADNGFTKRKPHEIPFLVTNLNTAVNPPYAATVNAAIKQAAADDSRTGIVDTTDGQYVSGLHFSSSWYTTLGLRFFTTWATIFDRDNYARRSLANLPTLASLRTSVRRRFERTTSANDSLSPQIDAFLNDSIREVCNTLGDNAWFLRRATEASIESGAFPGTISLDGHIARILRVESGAFPGKALVWKGISHTANLRTQITLHDYSTGPFVVHFIQLPTDLVVDDDVSVIPAQYSELVVVLTCKRLSEAAGNAQLATYYGIETQRLWSTVKRDCLRYDRMRQESMTTSDAYDTLRNGTSSDWLWSL